MAFDGFVINSVINELNSCLIDGKINKVFEPNKNELILGIYANSKNYALYISIDSNNYRLHLTTSSKPNPYNALNFCMFLRKHIVGYKIKSITSYNLERIVFISLEGFNELNDKVRKTLIIELMGKHSNIILVNENNIIIDSLRHLDTFSNSLRNILPAHPYSVPNSSKVSILNVNQFSDFFNILKDDLNIYSISDNITSKFNGVSKTYVSNMLETLNLPDFSSNIDDLKLIYNYMKDSLTSNVVLKNYINNKQKQDYVITPGNSSSLDINFFLDDFYSKKENDETIKNYRNSILKIILNELKKYSKRLYNINQKLEECLQMETYKLYGELITANLYRIKDENTAKISLENYYDNNNIVVIPLDQSICVSDNAKKYFKKYNKLKNALHLVTLQKQDTKNEIDYLESVVYELESSKTLDDINSIYMELSEHPIFKDKFLKSKSKKDSKKATTEISSPIKMDINGYTIYIGKNNKQNDYLTLKFANNNDIWFHTKDIHGSHLILVTNGKEISQELINKCAGIAAFYSKAKDSSNVPVDYTLVKYVKKPSGAKPGMVIYTNYTTVNVQPISNFI